MLGELVPVGGGDPIPLLKSKLMIGRRDSCDISLRFPNISSHHCELELINGYWRLRDLGSRNGTKVNGTRIDSVWILPGDELSVAKHRYEMRYTPLGDAPPPDNEDIMSKSLLEKAGLARSSDAPPRRPANRPPTVPPPAPMIDETTEGFFLEDESDPIPTSGRNPGGSATLVNKKKPESDESIALKWLDAAAEDE